MKQTEIFCQEPCVSCDSKKFSILLKSEDHFLTHEHFSVAQCIECGLKRTYPLPNQDEIKKYYQSEEYISHTSTNKGLVNKLYLTIRNHTLKRKYSWIKKYGKGTSLLDFGAGSGHFISFMNRKGFNTTGIEPSDNARKHCKENFAVDLFDETHLDKIPERSLDVITMWHVLEHIHDPSQLLDKFTRLLKKNGRIFIAVPNFESFDSKFYKNHWAALDLPRHIHHFTNSTLSILLSHHNLEIDKIKPLIFDSYYISLLSENYLNSKIKYIRAPFIGLLSNILGFFKGNKYSSCLYVIKMKN